MKYVFLIATLCLMLAVSGSAQTVADTPASREDVEKYFLAVHSRETNRQVMRAMSTPLHQMIHDIYLKGQDSLPPDFEEQMNRFMDNLLAEMSFDKLEDKMIPLYQRHFTQGDLAALSEFYSSPTGQKVLKEMPSIVADSMQFTTPIMREQLDKMRERVEQQVAQLKQSVKPQEKNSTTRN